MNLTFYNHYGNGDLFESREFVLDWMRLAGVATARYAHRRLPGLFADLPQIESIDVTSEMDMRAAVTWREGDKETRRQGDKETRGQGDKETRGSDSAPTPCPLVPLSPCPSADLWVNTWIGARNATTNPPGDYVLWPGVGCTVENLYRMHNDYLREAGLPPLPRSVAEYLPTIDYSRVKLGGSDAFIRKHHGKKLILICNGATGSGHASNFDYARMLHFIPWSDDREFIFTERCGIEGVYFSDDITNRHPGEWDLNAISYLSRFCDVIVGRCSGAQMFTQVLPNWMDGTKTQVCFTQHRNGACFVLDPEALGLRMKVAWSPAEDAESAAEFLKGFL